MEIDEKYLIQRNAIKVYKNKNYCDFSHNNQKLFKIKERKGHFTLYLNK